MMPGTYRPAPGCVIRTDYVMLLRTAADNPGINKTELIRGAFGGRLSESMDRRLRDLVGAGMLFEIYRQPSYAYEITDKGRRHLEAAERALREVSE